MTDVAVYGATAAGVAAAVAARACGATTSLVDGGKHIGGMVSGGLSWTDVGDTRVLGGFARRFYAAVADHYGAPLWGVRGPEPHVAEELLTELLDGVDIRLGDASVPEAEIYVDATYEGDLLPHFGVPYAVGREPRELYGERWAGRQPAYRPGKHNFPVVLSPFDDDGGLLPHIRGPELDEQGWPVERIGAGDGGLQAYGLRVCLQRGGDAFEQPAHYDGAQFELLRRYLHACDVRASDLLGLVPNLLPHGKCDVNSIGPFSLNVLDGSNRSYPDGDAAARERVRSHHLRYTQSFLWFLSTDDDVPLHIREELRGWGLCRDEFTDSGGWPHQLYVRDARRMVGEYVLREDDLVHTRDHDDAVAYGSYNIDIREIERTWRYLPEYEPTPAVFNEGYVSVPVAPYPIPLRCLRPRREDCEQLLVAVCVSASHVAFGSVRMEPTLMLLGEAAGTAAALAARAGCAVHDVDAADVRERLRAAGQVVAL